MRKIHSLMTGLCLLISAGSAQAQLSPLITSWKINTTHHTVTNGSVTILTDVEAVYYDSSYAYIKTSGVPGDYDFTNNNVNDASDLKAVFKFPRVPQVNTGTAFSTLGGGQYGLFRDGTLFFNGEDARSYMNANIWHQLAYYFEGKDFDSTWGHSTPTNEYHHHVIDLSLIDTTKKNVHSPLIGFAFDGYPVYGPFGYTDPNDMSSKVILMTPSYQKRNITDRTTLPDGTQLTTSQYGPAINSTYPIGIYREDYTFVQGSGTLDAHNGRFTKTPEYPNGTYAYFATVDSKFTPVYPFIVGQTYYGVPAQGNFGPNGGKMSVPSGTVKYSVATGINANENAASLSFYPNPAKDFILLQFSQKIGNEQLEITDLAGRTVQSGTINGQKAKVNVAGLNAGIYLLRLTDGNTSWTGKFVKE